MDNVDNVDKKSKKCKRQEKFGRVFLAEGLQNADFKNNLSTCVEKIVEKKNPQPKSPTNR
ncbi:MAG: hypothetical protein K2O03_15435 [Lachnospiraceae bacterium]|nr:hypothetical protein [Lachnospiraceae bacterium]